MIRVRTLAAILGLVFAALVAFAPLASAQADDETYPLTTTPPTVLGNDFEKDPPAQVDSSELAQADSLPVTGGDVLGLTVIGVVAVGAGLALVRYQRRSDTRV